MSTSNVYNWIKKTNRLTKSNQKPQEAHELDEMSWFVERKKRSKIRENIPILTRRSRYFARTLETLYAVVFLFVDAYQ